MKLVLYDSNGRVGNVRDEPYEWEYTGKNEDIEAILSEAEQWTDTKADIGDSEGSTAAELDVEMNPETRLHSLIPYLQRLGVRVERVGE